MRNLKDLLNGNSALSADLLPLVHSSTAYHIHQCLESGQVQTNPCDIFEGDELAYFFVGRPAYKKIGKDRMHWELPSTLILDFDHVNPKRVFPFDTGAFKRKMHPDYATMFELEQFELDSTFESAKRYIGTFFGNAQNYFNMSPVSFDQFKEAHLLQPTDAVIHSIYSLANGERIKDELDDRRATIELQFDQAVSLAEGNILAAIMPEVYLEDEVFVEELEQNGVELITYPIYPLNSDAYYFAIYERCSKFFSERGMI